MPHHHLPFSSVSLNLAVNSQQVLREQAATAFTIDADLSGQWYPESHTYALHIQLHTLNSANGWSCPATLMKLLAAIAAQVLALNGYTHYVQRSSLQGQEPLSGSSFSCEFKGIDITQHDTLLESGWSSIKKIIDTQMMSFDLVHPGAVIRALH